MLKPLLSLLLGLAVAGGCSPEPEDTVADDVRRAKAEAAALEQKWTQAAELLAPLVAREDAPVEDLVRAALIELQLDHIDVASHLTERAHALAPQDPAVANLRGNLFKRALEFERAVECFRQVVAADAGDLASRYLLGETLEHLGEIEAAREQYTAIRATGLNMDPPLYKMATFKLWRLLLTDKREAEAQAMFAEHDSMKTVTPLTTTELWARGYGRVRPPTHRPVAPGPPPTARWPAFREAADVDLHGAENLLAADLDADGRLDLCGWGARGLTLALQTAPGQFSVQVVHERATLDAAAGDLDPSDPDQKDGPPALEIVTIESPAAAGQGGVVAIFGRDAGSGPWRMLGPDGLQSGDARAVILSDFDHEGDLDIVTAGDGGLRLQRNDGAMRTPAGQFPDATPDAARALGPSRAVISEDLDGDNDVDYLVVTDKGLSVLSNLRGGNFADTTQAWSVPQTVVPAGTEARQALAVLDLDEDGRTDIVFPKPAGDAGNGVGNGLLWARGETGRFATPAALDGDGGSLSHRTFADLDLDGHVDLLGAGGATLSGKPGPLTSRTQPAPLSALPGSRAGAFAAADLDADNDLDIVVLQAGHAHVLAADGPPAGNALPVVLHGRKANPQGVGSIVELTAGPLYRRIYWRGGPLLLGLGPQAAADVVRVAWPDGITGAQRDLPAGQLADIVQPEGLGGSCPFLYTWNGATFQLVTDVLGTTPLGLPYAPGQYVPFNHEEYVKVRGDQLVPRDGRLDLALTEELREVTYLDRAVLHAIDHPAGTEIEPNERFTFPPFPEAHVHTLTDVRSPTRIIASNGEDVTVLLATVDDRHAQPFVKAPPQYRGLAEPWWLEITLADTPAERAAIAAAPAIRLAATGWFQWSDSSVNLAAARHPHWRFEPPTLQVPDETGAWQQAGPPLGFPAGKTKTMVVDITDRVNRADPRIRIATTLQLSWDALRIVLDADDASFRDTELPPATASLAFRGFSVATSTPGGELPERFDWNALAPEPRWNQHPGLHTRYGDVLPLLGAPDDMYVILGAGDCVMLSFDATSLPPLPDGWTRDYLLHLDGWAKDRDPNTNAAERVEPLPFHAMTAYPPPPGEHFPDDEPHRRWQQEWNTREGAVLIRPLR